MPDISMTDLLRDYTPGTGKTWGDHARELLSHRCLCPSEPPDKFVHCETLGHYQLMLEYHLRERGRVEQPICLGRDRVLDGHHRVVAAIRLGFDRIPVE